MFVPILVLLVGHVEMASDWITPVENGVVLSTPRPLATVQGEWSVIIVIRPPEAKVLEEERAHVRSMAHKLNGFTGWLGSSTRCEPQIKGTSGGLCVSWRQVRLLQYQLTLLAEKRPRTFELAATAPERRKRGLLNFVGGLSKTLFGTATEADLQQVRQAISRIRRSNRHIAHFAEEYKTVIDHAVKQQQADGRRIEAMVGIIKELRNITSGMYWAFGLHEKISYTVERLTYLQHIDRELDIQELQLQRLVGDLDRGRLTEYLLPPSALQEIMSGYTTAFRGGRALPDVWYYQTCSIDLLLSEEGQYVYQAKLPLITTDDYFYYTLQSYPVPTDKSGLRRQVIVRPEMGYNTASGRLFVPTGCMGKRPMVCAPTIIYKDTRYDCERGIITDFGTDKRECGVLTMSTNITELYEGGLDLVLVTNGEEVSLSCPGQEPQKEEVTFGTYRLPLRAGCTFSGPTWTRTAALAARANGTLTENHPKWDSDGWILEPMPAIPAFPVQTLGPREVLPSELPGRSYYDATADEEDQIYDYSWDYGSTGHHVSWTSIGLIIVVIVILIIAARWLYIRRRAIMFFIGRKDKPIKPKDTETVELTEMDKKIEDQV